ncbi:DNA polymerase lambda-like [Gigantopelta aegis]|uniref:DNA polymerase lambda-like n=1 Tax=Gigantopelta aegis TaxID=1735272 RepID=UPI001B88D2DE|nr:DNA polymerase lambda-like [Gigantopelta aegis]
MSSKKRKDCEKINISQTKKQKLPDTSKSASKTSIEEAFLTGVDIFIMKAGIQKARIKIFETQLEKYGAVVCNEISSSTRHILVDDTMDVDRMCRLLKLESAPQATVVKTTWLSTCLRQKKLIQTQEFELDLKEHFNTNITKGAINLAVQSASDSKTSCSEVQTVPNDKCPKVGIMFNAFKKSNKSEMSGSDSDYKASDEERDVQACDESGYHSPSTSSNETVTPNTSPGKAFPTEKWICTQSSKNPRPNFNQHVTETLEEMVKNYESTNDKWRAFGYQKAIQAIRRCPKQISTWEEAKALPGVGSRLADKIWEIIQSGELRKLNEFKSNDEIKVLNMFTNVWGAGPTTARQWYQQGLRTIDDLKTKAHLTHQQKVGVRLYDDLLERMPREEAGEIEQVVKEAAEKIQPGIIAQACGSYRRGKATCGDVDILVTHPDGKSHLGMYGKLLSALKETGFLTDDLVSVEDNGNQKKYLGVCKLPGDNRKHRRLDIIVVPYDEYGCALVYFTGSAHFNRSLRHLCKKQNMSLNEHALRTGVVRKGTEKIFEGTKILTPTEESVFKALNVPVRPPEERDH